MKTQTIKYFCKGTAYFGYLAYEEFFPPKRPLILIAHTWHGINEFIKKKAHDLAELGYIAFAADVYGSGQTAESAEKAAALMQPLFLDRSELRERIAAAFQFASVLPEVDINRIGAIGFCFGGLTVIELLRTGLPLRGIVSFHAVLSDRLGDKKAILAPNSYSKKTSVLILHGNKDPLAPVEDLLYLQRELTEANMDWQTNTYGLAAHSFTNPKACDASAGMCFEPLANHRSFEAMCNFFNERFL